MIRTLLIAVMLMLALVVAVLAVQSREEIARYRDMRRM